MIPYFKFILVLGILATVTSCTSNIRPADFFLAQGDSQFNQGELAKAIDHWQHAATLYGDSGNLRSSLTALLNIADAYQRVGHYQRAFSLLHEQVLPQAEQLGDEGQLAAAYSSLGQTCLLLDQPEEARRHFEKSLELAKAAKQPVLQAVTLLHLGQWETTVQQDYESALAHFAQSHQLAQQHHQTLLALKGLMNRAWIFLEQGYTSSARAQLAPLWSPLQQLPNSHEKAYLLKKYYEFQQQLVEKSSQESFSLLLPILTAMQETAQVIRDQCMLSQAAGELGHLYEQHQQYLEAQQLTQQAIFAGQSGEGSCRFWPYRWHWQQGRLQTVQGHLDEAITAYQIAQEEIIKVQAFPPEKSQQSTTACAATGEKSEPDFETAVTPVFLQLANLLLQRAKPEDLKNARAVMERLKEKELQEYFRNQCVTTIFGKPLPIDEIGIEEGTVVIYPVVFEKRLELLVSLRQDKQVKFTIPVSATQVQNSVNALRRHLEEEVSEHNQDYLVAAQQLYQWLIQPLLPFLEEHHIKTLVIVPDRWLRTIPLAVLHDGKQFLIEQYALATTPGVNLTAPNRNLLSEKEIRVLSSMLSEVTPEMERKGYKKLSYSEEFKKKMQERYPNQHQLIGQKFTVANLAKELETTPYTLLHISSHATFAAAKDSVMATYDQEMSLDKLAELIKSSKYRQKEEALELLILDACETAKGDEKAALGLAGVALQAGARSALATLWKVNENVSYHLTSKFYQEVTQSPVSKARALQEAQKSLLNSQYKHPRGWGAFVLIGNWL